MRVINECKVDYNYRFCSQSPIISKTIVSNIVATQIIKDTILLTKYVNKELTFSFDILIYTITIENIINYDIDNILFKDNIPQNTKFIKNSVTINKVKSKCKHPEIGFFIEKLKVGEKVEVSFKVMVLPIFTYNLIVNSSTIKYDYIYNVEKLPLKLEKESNKVTTKCDKRVFKQITNLNTLKTCHDINEILRYKINIDIVESRVINKLRDNICTNLVIGKIGCKMWYKSNYYERYIEDTFGFSTCISVPIGITLENKCDVNYDIEYSSIDLVNNNTALINICLLLYY